MRSPSPPPEALDQDGEPVAAWRLTVMEFDYTIPHAETGFSLHEEQGRALFRLLDGPTIAESPPCHPGGEPHMSHAWRHLCRQPAETAKDFLSTAARSAPFMLRDPEFHLGRVANQNARLARLVSHLDEIIGTGGADLGLLEGIAEAFEVDADWSGMDLRSSLGQLREWAHALANDPDARAERFGAGMGNTNSKDGPAKPLARLLAARLKARIDSPALVAHVASAALGHHGILTNEDARKITAAPTLDPYRS